MCILEVQYFEGSSYGKRATPEAENGVITDSLFLADSIRVMLSNEDVNASEDVIRRPYLGVARLGSTC